MKLKNHIILITLFLTAQISLAQDSIRIDSELSVETKGQHNLASLANDFDCWHCKSGKVENNPLFHLAIYTGIDHKLILNKKYTLETGLYLEERSHSGGNNTLSNLVLFPKILLQVDDSIKVLNKDIGVHIKGGDLWNEDIGDMLRFYNIDYQGIIGKLKLNQWEASFMSIGDLSKNIGLDLHQTYRFALGYKNQSFWNLSSFTINELITSPRGLHPTEIDINIANYSKFELNSDINIEGQVETRLNRELSNSIALGLQLNYASSNQSLSSSLRYFSSEFNFGYNGDEPRYSRLNGSFVGSQLYPLKNYYRQYSQWAAYTHIGSSDLIAMALTSKWDKKMYHKLGIFYDLDINYIYDLNNRKGYLYPIYNAGLQIYFLNAFYVKLSLTNKHMELRDFFQTFSISKSPFVSMSVNMKLNKIQLKTRYIES